MKISVFKNLAFILLMLLQLSLLAQQKINGEYFFPCKFNDTFYVQTNVGNYYSITKKGDKLETRLFENQSIFHELKPFYFQDYRLLFGNNQIFVCNIDSDKCLTIKEVSFSSPFNIISHDSIFIDFDRINNKINIFSFDNKLEYNNIDSFRTSAEVEFIRFSEDGKSIFLVYKDGLVEEKSLFDGILLRKIKFPIYANELISDGNIVKSPDGNMFALFTNFYLIIHDLQKDVFYPRIILSGALTKEAFFSRDNKRILLPDDENFMVLDIEKMASAKPDDFRLEILNIDNQEVKYFAEDWFENINTGFVKKLQLKGESIYTNFKNNNSKSRLCFYNLLTLDSIKTYNPGYHIDAFDFANDTTYYSHLDSNGIQFRYIPFNLIREGAGSRNFFSSLETRQPFAIEESGVKYYTPTKQMFYIQKEGVLLAEQENLWWLKLNKNDQGYNLEQKIANTSMNEKGGIVLSSSKNFFVLLDIEFSKKNNRTCFTSVNTFSDSNATWDWLVIGSVSKNKSTSYIRYELEKFDIDAACFSKEDSNLVVFTNNRMTKMNLTNLKDSVGYYTGEKVKFACHFKENKILIVNKNDEIRIVDQFGIAQNMPEKLMRQFQNIENLLADDASETFVIQAVEGIFVFNSDLELMSSIKIPYGVFVNEIKISNGKLAVLYSNNENRNTNNEKFVIPDKRISTFKYDFSTREIFVIRNDGEILLIPYEL